MNSSSLAISFAFQRWQVWVLQAVALIALASCVVPGGNAGLSGAAAPNVQGVYQGSYTYGGAYQKLAGQTVAFEISLHQARGSSKITGVIKEDYAGTGTPKDGFLWADIVGTCVRENGVIHLQFRKTFRHSKLPPVTYRGSLPEGSSLLAGTWYLPDKPTDSGMFQINGVYFQ
jgi:hypothetical protein